MQAESQRGRSRSFDMRHASPSSVSSTQQENYLTFSQTIVSTSIFPSWTDICGFVV
jgi:hypothetical protein